MPATLEVIVTSACEALDAEMGGADRLELTRDLDTGGLTPRAEAVRHVLASVSIPVRVMVRETASLSIESESEVASLRVQAAAIAAFPVNGLVIGFVKDGEIDSDATRRVLDAAPHCRATFHRAFDEAADPLRAIECLKKIRAIDRILTSGGTGEWPERKRRLMEWQRAASPEIKLIVAAGLCPLALAELQAEDSPFEFHVGRAARRQHIVSNPIDREQIASLKTAAR